MKNSTKRTAIVYDFDGTLSPGNMQEHTLIPSLGLTTSEFWAQVKAEAKRHDAEEISTYMRLLRDTSERCGKPLTRELLAFHGDQLRLFEGVESWFARQNAYAEELGLELQHYVISSGLLEMIAACGISKSFAKIYASGFIYDEAGRAVWPGMAINYTTKTQFLFRINKGINNAWDNEAINEWLPLEDRPIPFDRMIFLGDGATDIPSMKMVRHQGGYAVAVFDPEKWNETRTQDLIHRLIAADRCNYVAPANYAECSQLDVTVRGILRRISEH